jgi:hypothetical protein
MHWLQPPNFDCLSVNWVNCCWPSPAQSFLVPSPAGLMTILFCLTTLRVIELTPGSQVKVKVTLRLTVSQSVSLGVEPHLGLMTRYFHYSLTVTVLFLWGVPSDERTGLSFVYAASSCQRSLFRVRVPWDSRPYFTVSDLRLPFSSPPTTRRVTRLGTDHTENTVSIVPLLLHVYSLQWKHVYCTTVYQQSCHNMFLDITKSWSTEFVQLFLYDQIFCNSSLFSVQRTEKNDRDTYICFIFMSLCNLILTKVIFLSFQSTVFTVPLTHSLTHSWSWALLEKLPIVQPLKNFPAFYGTRRFITTFTRALVVPILSQIDPIHPIPSYIYCTSTWPKSKHDSDT